MYNLRHWDKRNIEYDMYWRRGSGSHSIGIHIQSHQLDIAQSGQAHLWNGTINAVWVGYSWVWQSIHSTLTEFGTYHCIYTHRADRHWLLTWPLSEANDVLWPVDRHLFWSDRRSARLDLLIRLPRLSTHVNWYGYVGRRPSATHPPAHMRLLIYSLFTSYHPGYIACNPLSISYQPIWYCSLIIVCNNVHNPSYTNI